jgi:putative transposase
MTGGQKRGFPNRRISDSWGGNRVGGCCDYIRTVTGLAGWSSRHGIVTVTGLAARPEGDQNGRMTSPPDPLYRHRFPAEIISYAVWLYHMFSLSFRDVELILAERGVLVSYETVRRWCKKFAASFADRLRRRRPRPELCLNLGDAVIRRRSVLACL